MVGNLFVRSVGTNKFKTTLLRIEKLYVRNMMNIWKHIIQTTELKDVTTLRNTKSNFYLESSSLALSQVFP